MIQAEIIESFPITDRGTVAVIDAKTELPVGRCLEATILHLDGSSEHHKAWKEWLLRRSKEPLEDEAFLIADADMEQVPVGASIILRLEGA